MKEIPPRRFAPWKWLFRLAIGLAILGLLLLRRETASQVKDTFSTVQWWVLLAAVGFYWAGQLLSVYRWQLLLKARDIDLPFRSCVQLYAAGMFGNLFLPTSIGGDALRAGLLTKMEPRAPLPEAAASILVERVTGFVALLIVATLGGAAQQAGPALWGGLALLLAFMGALAVTRRLMAGGRTEKGMLAKLRRIWEALDFYFAPERRGALAAAVGLSLIFQASQVSLNAWLGMSIHLPVPFPAYFWIHPLMALAAMLPLGIGGLGVREAAAMKLLQGGGWGITEGSAVAWSLLWQATVWLSSLPGVAALRVKTRN